MATGRHLYRENALAVHQKLMKEKTVKFTTQSKQAMEAESEK
jgi:hypothetical protein